MLDQLEKEANDEFLLLESVGAGEFSTEHLLELRDDARLRLKDYDRRNRVNVGIGLLIFGWLLAFFYAYAYANVWLAIAAVVGLLFSLVACIAGIFLLVRQYKSRQDLEISLKKIENELFSRR
jgi:apolipoprotein N-acyltransferase